MTANHPIETSRRVGIRGQDLDATKVHPPTAEAAQLLPALTPAQAPSRRCQPDEGDAVICWALGSVRSFRLTLWCMSQPHEYDVKQHICYCAQP
jgi:hypothetical protein